MHMLQTTDSGRVVLLDIIHINGNKVSLGWRVRLFLEQQVAIDRLPFRTCSSSFLARNGLVVNKTGTNVGDRVLCTFDVLGLEIIRQQLQQHPLVQRIRFSIFCLVLIDEPLHVLCVQQHFEMEMRQVPVPFLHSFNDGGKLLGRWRPIAFCTLPNAGHEFNWCVDTVVLSLKQNSPIGVIGGIGVQHHRLVFDVRPIDRHERRRVVDQFLHQPPSDFLLLAPMELHSLLRHVGDGIHCLTQSPNEFVKPSQQRRIRSNHRFVRRLLQLKHLLHVLVRHLNLVVRDQVADELDFFDEELALGQLQLEIVALQSFKEHFHSVQVLVHVLRSQSDIVNVFLQIGHAVEDPRGCNRPRARRSLASKRHHIPDIGAERHDESRAFTVLLLHTNVVEGFRDVELRKDTLASKSQQNRVDVRAGEG